MIEEVNKMNEAYEKLLKCVESVKKKVDFEPRVGIVLGSGLGDYANEINIVKTLEYSEIENFPVSTVVGHKGRFVFGYVQDVPVVIMQGRVHFYEGYSMKDVVLPTRIMAMLGVKKLVLTNAAGGINEAFNVGDFMLINDHISSFVPSPLIGENIEALGTRFPDMTEVYSKELSDIVRESAKKLGIGLREGVYIQLSGPAYETSAEIKMYRALGADAVGMSTVCEAIAATHAGLKVCGISCITNMATGVSDKKLDHKEVQETADRVSRDFKNLVSETVKNL
jgi:purine nucleoside phosphorylase I, inosine and guanosine-specific